MAAPGGGKDATVIGTLTVSEGVGVIVIEVENTPPKKKPGAGVTIWSSASVSLRTAAVSSMAFPSRRWPT